MRRRSFKTFTIFAKNVNECARKLPRSYIDCDIIKLTLKENYDEIERNVRIQINDLTFLDMYFNITFLELTSLHFNEILHIILSNRNFCISLQFFYFCTSKVYFSVEKNLRQ